MPGRGQAQSCLICSYRDFEPVQKPGSMSMEHAPLCRHVACRVTLGQDTPPLSLHPLCVVGCVGIMPDKLPPHLTTSENKVTLKNVQNSAPVQPFFCYHQNMKHCIIAYSNRVGPDKGSRSLLHKSLFVPEEETTLEPSIDGV